MQLSTSGTPQGSILSPLLSNIILHEFDKYMEGYMLEFNKGKTRKANPEYSKLHHLFGARVARRVGQADRMDPQFRRMHYVRYADDFVITIIGSKEDAKQIKSRCSQFLSGLKLTLHDDKTLITNPMDRPVAFLGFLIQKTAPIVKVYYRKYHGKLKRVIRLSHGSIFLKVDAAKVIKRLHEKGFCNGEGSPLPNFKYLSNTQHGTIIQINYILRGLANYYQLANNARQMISKWNYILRFSTAMMFAAKYRLGTIAKVFAIAGKDLAKTIKKESTNSKKAILGQTEERIQKYLDTIGVPKRSKTDARSVGILYTRYSSIQTPDIKPLAKNFNPTF